MVKPQEYSLAQCIGIACAPLLLALVVAYFAEPSGQLLLDFNPLGWIFDYLVIWPLVWLGSELIHAGQVLTENDSAEAKLKMKLRLTGGILLIYLFVWWIAVPLIGQFVIDNKWLGADPPAYSQVFRFLLGAGGALVFTLARKSFIRKT